MLPLTNLPGVPDKRDVRPGMAYFAGTGPDGTTCGTCSLRGLMRPKIKERFDKRTNEFVNDRYRYQGCSKFHSLGGQYGPVVEADYPSCKYFVPKAKA